MLNLHKNKLLNIMENWRVENLKNMFLFLSGILVVNWKAPPPQNGLLSPSRSFELIESDNHKLHD